VLWNIGVMTSYGRMLNHAHPHICWHCWWFIHTSLSKSKSHNITLSEEKEVKTRGPQTKNVFRTTNTEFPPPQSNILKTVTWWETCKTVYLLKIRTWWVVLLQFVYSYHDEDVDIKFNGYNLRNNLSSH